MARLDLEALAETVISEELRAAPLSERAQRSSMVVDELLRDIELIAGAVLPPDIRARAIAEIAAVPIGPPVPPSDLSFEVVDALAEAYSDAPHADRHIATAMELVWETNDRKFTKDQLLINPRGLPKIGVVSPQDFWTDVVFGANQNSRRTLAGLILTPGRHRSAKTFDFVDDRLGAFAYGPLRAPGWPTANVSHDINIERVRP